MAGSKAGGIKTVARIKERDPDFYKKIGAIGGRKKGLKGFALHPELAKVAGRKGGAKGKRKPRYDRPLDRLLYLRIPDARQRSDMKREMRQAMLQLIGEDVSIDGLDTDASRALLGLLHDYQADLRKKVRGL